MPEVWTDGAVTYSAPPTTWGPTSATPATWSQGKERPPGVAAVPDGPHVHTPPVHLRLDGWVRDGRRGTDGGRAEARTRTSGCPAGHDGGHVDAIRETTHSPYHTVRPLGLG